MFLWNTFKRYSCLIIRMLNVNLIYNYILPCLYFASVCWCVLPFLQPVWLFGLYRVLTSPRKKGKTTYQSAKARTDTLIQREQKIMFTITWNQHLWHWIQNVRALALNALLTLTLDTKYVMWVITTVIITTLDYHHGASKLCARPVRALSWGNQCKMENSSLFSQLCLLKLCRDLKTFLQRLQGRETPSKWWDSMWFLMALFCPSFPHTWQM